MGVLLVSGCSDLEGTGDLQYISGEGAITQVAPEDREDPVDVAGETLDGDALDLADLRGRVVVVNVWGSWCNECRPEMPWLVSAHEDYRDRGVAFVGIDIRDASVDNARSFERSYGVDYPSLYDRGSETLLRFGRYAPTAPPSTILLDTEGRVAVLISGAIPSEKTLTDLIDETVAEGDGDG